jgi:transposase-like protein
VRHAAEKPLRDRTQRGGAVRTYPPADYRLADAIGPLILNGARMSAAKIRAGSRMEIITGVERRRRWSSAERLRIVAETEQPGAGVGEIARRYEISRGLLWNWRSQVRRGILRPEPTSVFVPVHVVSEPAHVEPDLVDRPGPVVTDSKIEITLTLRNVSTTLIHPGSAFRLGSSALSQVD